MKLEKKMIKGSQHIEAPDSYTIISYQNYLDTVMNEYGDCSITDESDYDEGPSYVIHFEVLESDEALADRQKRHDLAEERKLNPTDKQKAREIRLAAEKERKRLMNEKKEKKMLADLKLKYEV